LTLAAIGGELAPAVKEGGMIETQPKWAPRLARWAIVLTVVALIIAALSLTLARYDLIPKFAGFSAFLGAGLLAVLATLSGLAALIAGRNVPGLRSGKLLGALAVSAVFAGFLLSRPMAAGDIPAIHDITTDLANPPQFAALPLRADNLAGVGTVENWQKLHAKGYPELKTVTIAKPVGEVMAKALKQVEAAGWKVAKSDPQAGTIEATASVSYIRFQDDVAIRIVPSADGKGSQVDMRSVSRIGVSDFGVNAKRIRAFLAALAAD
jgi:Protein of unknown function (DUF1499)